ncbi:MAG: hypothetical protein R3190_13715, partial [Thermoanaerobaculia bacterium]|nr:hypothetical protein [Thermoanaerobaculia bacterium]
ALPLDGDPERESHPQARYEAFEPVWVFKLLGFKKEIYRPLAQEFEKRGWRLGTLTAPEPGDDAFFFLYDWRRSNQESVRELHRQLTALAAARGADDQAVDLICQSNAARICRWLAKYGSLSLAEAERGAKPEPAPYRLRKLVLVGASNSGTLRVLEQLHRGRRHIRAVGRKLSPEALFTNRALFEDLPLDRGDLFVGPDGEPLDVDLSDPDTWVELGLSIFSPDAQRRIEKSGRRDIFGSFEDQVAYVARWLDAGRRIAALLERDSPLFGDVRYYLLENASQPTIDRALLVKGKGRWRTFFMGDTEVDDTPRLERVAVVAGDGHASISSQRDLSPQEQAAKVRSVAVEGGHFEMLIADAALDALFGFLAD